MGVMETEPKWYVLHTFSNYENIAKENLKLVIENFNLHERIFDIVIPMQDVVEKKDGKKVIVSKKILPSYIFIKMIYGDDIWHAITRTRGVTGFAGPKGRPLPLSEDEIRQMHLEDIECIYLPDNIFKEQFEINFPNYNGRFFVFQDNK